MLGRLQRGQQVLAVADTAEREVDGEIWMKIKCPGAGEGFRPTKGCFTSQTTGWVLRRSEAGSGFWAKKATDYLAPSTAVHFLLSRGS